MKKYLAYDGINCEYEMFDSIEEAENFLKDSFLVENEYHPDLESCCIYELHSKVKFYVLDSKENYKFQNEEDIPDDDEESEAWPYDNAFDIIGKHRFIEIKCDSNN